MSDNRPELTDNYSAANSCPSQPTCSAALRRKSKLMAATVIAAMLDHWMCDGYSTGNDADEYDLAIFRAEALRFQRLIDARVAKLRQPNASGEGRKPAQKGEP